MCEALMDAYGPVGRSEWMDMDWRRHLRWVRIGGRLVNVVDIGEGAALIFVHGLSGSWQNWLETIPHFARDHRVIALDLPGFGQSEMPAEPISVSGYARMLEELYGALAIASATIVGTSMGGFVGADFAIRYPHRVERLVLVAAAGLSMEWSTCFTSETAACARGSRTSCSSRRRGWHRADALSCAARSCTARSCAASCC